jgi:hypothetical protein
MPVWLRDAMSAMKASCKEEENEMPKITSFSLLGVELVRLASKGNVVNAGGASIHSGLFRDALRTQPNLRRKTARFIMSPIVADEYMDYRNESTVGDDTAKSILAKDHNRYGDCEFEIIGWLPTDVVLLASPGGIKFRPFSKKRLLTFDNPRSVTLIKNIGRAEKAVGGAVPPLARLYGLFGAHFIGWMHKVHNDVPLDAVPSSIVDEYLDFVLHNTEGTRFDKDTRYDMSAVCGKESHD